MDKLDKYLNVFYLQEDASILNEFDFNKMLAKYPDENKALKFARDVNKSLDKSDPVKSLKMAKGMFPPIPVKNVSLIDKYLTSKFQDFKKYKQTSFKILSNSLDNNTDPKMVDVAATFVTAASMFTKKNEKGMAVQDNLKKMIKEFVMKTRKFADDYDDEKQKSGTTLQKEDLPDLAVAWTIVTMATALAIAVGTGLYTVAAAIAAMFTIGNLLWILLFLFLAFMSLVLFFRIIG